MEGIELKKNCLPISIILLVLVIAGYFVWTTYYSTVEPVYIVPFFFVFLIASLVFLVMWIKQNTGARIFAHGTNTVVMVIALIGVLVLINYISSKHSYRKDFTLNKTFSLSDQTEKILKGLNQNIMIYAFYQDGDSGSREQFKDLMEEYMHLSSKVNYKMIDPVKNPNKAIEYGVKQLNTVILEVTPDKREKLTEKVSEQALTNAILKLTKSGSNKVVYFLKGHTKGNADDFSAVKDALKKETYEVKDLMLLQDQLIPPDCSIIIIPGPDTALEKPELDAINGYLKGGGKLMVMVDPMKPDLAQFLSQWNIRVENDLVLDVSGIGQQIFGTSASMPLAVDYPEHEITKDMKGMATIYPLARSISVIPNASPKQGSSADVIINSLPQSWSYRGKLDKLADVKPDPSRDVKGPVSMGVAVKIPVQEEKKDASAPPQEEKKPGKETRIVVVGNSSFITNKYLTFQGNSDMFLNMINWLGQQEDLISIRPKNPEMHQLDLTGRQSILIALATLVVFPLLIIITGISVKVHGR